MGCCKCECMKKCCSSGICKCCKSNCCKCCKKDTKPAKQDTKPVPEVHVAEKVANIQKSKKESCKNCCKVCWTPRFIICWIVLFLSLGLGLFLLLHRSCRKFPFVVPYLQDQIVYYATVTFLFWTTFFTILFIMASKFSWSCGFFQVVVSNPLASEKKIIWTVIQILFGFTLIIYIFNIKPNERYEPDVLKGILGDQVGKHKWFLYLHNVETCCGVINSLDVSKQFVKQRCDPIFLRINLFIGCGPTLKAYVKHCQTILLWFAVVITCAGLIPFIIYCQIYKEIVKKANTVGPVDSDVENIPTYDRG